MFELLITNTLKSLLFPPGLFLLLWFVGLILLKNNERAARVVLWSGLGLGYLLSTPLVSGVLLQQLQSYPALTTANINRAQAQAIVVLSAGRYKNAPEYGGDTVGGNSLARVRYGAYLHRLTNLPLVVSGGHVFDKDGDSLARVMASSLQQDFRITDVWLEDQSRTTAENARLTRALLERKQIGRVFLVTHAVHMPRAVEAFRQAGVEVIPAPTRFVSLDEPWYLLLLPSAGAVGGSYYALHEMLGRFWYAVRH